MQLLEIGSYKFWIYIIRNVNYTNSEFIQLGAKSHKI